MATIAVSRPVQLDPGRVTAGAGAIALNVALLMLLMVPIAAPVIEDVAKQDDVIIIERREPVPPPPPPPVEVEVRQATREPTVTPTPQPPTQPPTDTTDDPQEGDIVVPPGDTHAIERPAEIVPPADDGRPMEGAHLEYASAPPPPYPREALVDGLTGTVMLKVLVDVDGRPLEVAIQRSSGHRALDAAARRQVLSKWRFRPAMRNGQAVQAIGVVPVEFKLD